VGLIAVTLQRPEKRYQRRRANAQQQIERQPQPGKVAEFVIARAVDQCIGLIADRSGETHAGGEHHADHEWTRELRVITVTVY